jgi:hypothetical protein
MNDEFPPYDDTTLSHIQANRRDERLGEPSGSPADANAMSDIHGASVIWSKGKYVTFDVFKNGFPTNKKPSRITAIVQPISVDENAGIFGEWGYVFGCNEKATTISCGKIRAKIVCAHDETHPVIYKHERCNDPGCPICYGKFSHRIADAVTERITGYRSVFGYNPVYHMIVWDAFRKGFKTLKESFTVLKARLKLLGVEACVAWYHPYRIKDVLEPQLRRYRIANGIPQSVGFWQLAHDDVLNLGRLSAYIELGPHWHIIGSGYVMAADEYSTYRLGGYRKVRYLSSEEDVNRVSYYISTHACREFGKSTVRYFGDLSYSKLARDDGVEEIVDLRCELCNNYMKEYYFSDELNEVTGVAHERVTTKLMHFKYWKRGDKPRGMKESVQLSIADTL